MSGDTPTLSQRNEYAVPDGASSPDGAGFGLQEGSGWTAGAGIIDSGYGTISALCEGSWVDAALSGVALTLDSAATAADPLGSALAAGIGWVIDHLNPIKKWFEEVAGNPGGAVAQAQTWGLVAADLGPTAQDWSASAAALMGPQQGPAVRAYQHWQDVETRAIAGFADAAQGMQEAITVAAGIVGFVHGFLRDVLAQLVGAAISWATEAILSFGTLIPWICNQIATRVAAVTARCSAFITGLVRSGSNLGTALSALGRWSREVLGLLDKVTPNPHLTTGRHRAEGPARVTAPPGSGRGRHRATLPDQAKDAVRGGLRDTTVNNASDATKTGRSAAGEPD